MAASTNQKLSAMVECSICLERLTNPQAFECMHFFCKECIDEIKPKTEDSVIGFDCPTCRQFTAKDKLRPMFVIQELLEVVAMAKDENPKCDTCNEVIAESRCRDCKENFCPSCQHNHNRLTALKHHKWEPLTERVQATLDKHVYCEKHSGEPVKFHCKDCQKLICIICNGTEHKLHSAETIEDAVEQTLATVKKHEDHVKTMITQNEQALTDARADVEKLEKKYAEMDKQIDTNYEDVIRKAKDDRKRVKESLAKTKNEQITGIKEWIAAMDFKVKSQKSVVAMCDTTVSAAQSTSLLQALQSGVRQSLELYTTDKSDIPPFRRTAVRLQSTPAPSTNLVGLVVENNLVYTRYINRPLSGVSKGTIKPVRQQNIGFSCTRFTKVENELWCNEFDTNKVHVFNGLFNKKQRVITFGTIGVCRTEEYVGSSLIIAASNGLFRSNIKGTEVKNILHGDIADLCWIDITGYALNNANGTVVIVRWDRKSDRFIKDKELKLKMYQADYRNTIYVTSSYIYIGLRGANSILQYAHDGTLLASFDLKDTPESQFRGPRICGADSHGSLLIAEKENNRMQILNESGLANCLKLEGLYEPLCAIIETDTMFVSQGNSVIKQFSIQ